MAVKTIGQLQRIIAEKYPSETGILTHSLGQYNSNREYSIAPEYAYLEPYLEDTDGLLEFENDTQKLLRIFQWCDIEYDGVKLARLARLIQITIKSREYELKTLIETTQLEYNPIDNVNEDIIENYNHAGTEKGNENRSLEYSTDTTNVNTTIGSRTDSSSNTTHNNYGTDTNNTNETIGSRTDNTSNTSNNNYGKTSGGNSTTENVAPDDSPNFNPNTQTTSNVHEDAHTDVLTTTGNITQGEQSNKYTTTRNAREDTSAITGNITQGEQSNKYATTRDAREDKDSLNIDMATTTSYNKHVIRHGNIGVTSSQQLIESERNIAHFSICEEIRRIIADCCLIRVYE